MADAQTNGYGRRGRQFYSPAQSGLYLSVVIPNPQADLTQVGLLTTGVATQWWLRCVNSSPRLILVEVVNDVMIHERKVAGILCEAVLALESSTSAAFVIGVGLNLDTAQFPDALKQVAGAISDTPIDRNALAASLIDHIMQRAKDYQLAISYQRIESFPQ